MRLQLLLSPNKAIVPFNYQEKLAGAFHKWLGENELHDDISLYSISWLQGGEATGKGLNFSRGAQWYISGHDENLLKCLTAGIQEDPFVAWGMRVCQIELQPTPQFGTQVYFKVDSPVFIKRKEEDGHRYYIFDEPEANALLTETLQTKLKTAGLPHEGVRVAFDSNYAGAKTKLIRYKGGPLRASMCPVMISGTPEQIAFAWHVGVGNSTGIGFGALV